MVALWLSKCLSRACSIVDGHHVWLRNRDRAGTYLHADDDGWGVSVRRRRASLNAAWAVHLYQGRLLLHSAAYGRYLATTPKPAPLGHRGFRVELRNYDQPADVDAITWETLNMTSTINDVLICNVNACYLRANGKYLRWNNAVSVDDFHNVSSMMNWIVESIPPRQGLPALPAPTWTFGRTMPECRTIRFTRARDDGVYSEAAWTSFTFRGRSVHHLGMRWPPTSTSGTSWPPPSSCSTSSCASERAAPGG
ncbi:unnamed protein product [Alopecurus aequalis]